MIGNNKQVRRRGYKVTEEYSNPGQLSKVSVELPQRKTWWDWLQLLIVPLVLVLVSSGFALEQNNINNANNSQQLMRDQTSTAQQHRADQQLATDQQQEATLKSYLDDISDLLFNHNLFNSGKTDEVCKVARARTITTLRRLNADRNKIVLQFLQDAWLIGQNEHPQYYNIIPLDGSADLSRDDLSGADLYTVQLGGDNFSYANLSGADLGITNLKNADLSGANLIDPNLSGANLSHANLSIDNPSYGDLSNANLSGANLSGANLSGANLSRANLSGANLSRASNLTQQQLDEVYSCQGAILPPGLVCHRNQ